MADGKQRNRGVCPPDGGWGWMVVLSCFMVTVCTRAVTRCISIFFLEFQAEFGADYSATAWIHSLVDCTTMLCAPVGSLVSNRWSCRVSVVAGGLLSSCGLLLSSFSSSLVVLYFSMGALTGEYMSSSVFCSSACPQFSVRPLSPGLGFALCYTPSIAMVGCYFKQRKALAYGVALSGSGIGIFVLAPVVQLFIELYSWRGALLVLSAFVANLCVCGALLRPITLLEEEEEENMKEVAGDRSQGNVLTPAATDISKEPSLQLLEETPPTQVPRRRCFNSCFLSSKEYRFLLLPDFVFFAVSLVFMASGCSIPFVYLVPYALSSGVSHQHAAFLMSILGIIDIVGNITVGWLTDRRCVKPYRLACYSFAIAMEGLCCLLVPLLHSFPLLVPFAVLYGYFDGAYVALIPVVTSDVVGAPYLSSALGVVYFLHAIPYLLSPPIGGWLVDITQSYSATFFLSSATLLASAIILFTAVTVRNWCRHSRGQKAQDPPPEPV